MSASSTSRRGLLAGIAALVPAAAVGGVPAADITVPGSHPDAELLDACEEFHAWHEAAYSCPVDDDELLEENLSNRWDWSAFMIKPVTSAGRRAKIKVALTIMEENRSKEPDPDWEFAFATLKDLAGGQT